MDKEVRRRKARRALVTQWRAYLGYRGGATLLGLLPGRLGRAIGILGGSIWSLSSRTRQPVEANLAHVLPELGPAELRRVARSAFSSYGIYWADGARLARLARTNRERPFAVEGMNHIEDAMKTGRGLILALPHLGCWEFGGRFLDGRGIHLVTVGEVLSPPALNDWFISTRREIGVDVIPLGPTSAPALLEQLRAGKAIALLADRDVAHDGVAVPFFGSTTTLPAGPAVLALRTGAALVPVAIYHQRDGSHRALALPPLAAAREGRLRDDVERVTGELAAALETLIRRAPEQWHVFRPDWPVGQPVASRS